jgi:hypothetical protein
MKKIDLFLKIGYDALHKGDKSPPKPNLERLPKMKAAIRIFALFVAIAGLASASFAPATTKALTTHAALSATGAGPTINLPAPLPCQLNNTCFASTTSIR